MIVVAVGIVEKEEEEEEEEDRKEREQIVKAKACERMEVRENGIE